MRIKGEWFTSSKSGAAGHCVEVLEQHGGGVSVRNSKSRELGTVEFTEAEWKAFIAGAREGEFDL